MKNAGYSKGEMVETPLGVGEIISEIEITGACKVRLLKPLEGGDSAGQTEITANTFQMRHAQEWFVKGVNRYFEDEGVAWEFCARGESPVHVLLKVSK